MDNECAVAVYILYITHVGFDIYDDAATNIKFIDDGVLYFFLLYILLCVNVLRFTTLTSALYKQTYTHQHTQSIPIYI